MPNFHVESRDAGPRQTQPQRSQAQAPSPRRESPVVLSLCPEPESQVRSARCPHKSYHHEAEMTPNSSTAVTTRRNSCADLENAQRHPLLKSGATARSRRACGAGQSRAHGPIICATCRRTVRSASPGAPHAQGRTKLSPGGPSYVRNWLHLRNRKGVSLCHLQGSKFKFLPMLLLALNWKTRTFLGHFALLVHY